MELRDESLGLRSVFKMAVDEIELTRAGPFATGQASTISRGIYYLNRDGEVYCSESFNLKKIAFDQPATIPNIKDVV